MDDIGAPTTDARGVEVLSGAQPSGRRRTTPAQRRREAIIDRRLELTSAGGGLALAGACAAAGAWSLAAAWGVDRFTVIAVLGGVAAVGGTLLAAHFAITFARIIGFIGRPPSDPTTAVPPEAWPFAIVIGAVGGGATGIDLGTLILIVGGRTPWDLPPATTMMAVVVLPIIGLVPLALAVGAASRRVWLRRPALLAGATWLAGSVAGIVASGVLAHLPGV